MSIMELELETGRYTIYCNTPDAFFVSFTQPFDDLTRKITELSLGDAAVWSLKQDLLYLTELRFNLESTVHHPASLSEYLTMVNEMVGRYTNWISVIQEYTLPHEIHRLETTADKLSRWSRAHWSYKRRARHLRSHLKAAQSQL